MKLFGRKQYVIAVIIIVLTLTLVILNSNSQAKDLTNISAVMSEQFGPLTYVIAVEKECDGVSVPPDMSRWMPRFTSDCTLKYYHLIGQTGKAPALVGITERLPTEEMMLNMISRYLKVAMHGGS